MSIIKAPGAYPDIAAEDYHGNPDLLPAPSLSSSGAKAIISQSPLHFWWSSPMNPDRPGEDDAAHFAIGRAAHDMILLTERWPEHYHVLPEGYNAGHSKKWAEAIAEAEAAGDAGKTVLRHQDGETVRAVAAALRQNKTAVAALTNGVAEETLAWQDPETGVWLRARPDFRPHSIATAADVIIVADLKFMAPSNASPDGFQRAVANNGYHQSAAFYADGLKAIYGRYPTHWLHVVVERDAPHCVALYPLPQEDIERGRWLNRRAIRRFAECLARGTDRASWPGYADTPVEVGLPGWQRKRVDDLGDAGIWSAAA
jgi:hypothetical protein